MTGITFLIYALACWRITHLVVLEDGPADLIKRLRNFASKLLFFRDLLSCVWCASIWVGAGLALADLLSPSWTARASLVFALSALSVIVERWMEVQYKWLK
jgi:hypothetical protein